MAPSRKTSSARNEAAANYLRGVKASKSPRVTNEMVADATGIDLEQVKRLLTNRAMFQMDDFSSIAEALGLDPADALRGAYSQIVSD